MERENGKRELEGRTRAGQDMNGMDGKGREEKEISPKGKGRQ